MRSLILRITLGLIAAFQIALGLLFIVAPGLYAQLVGLPRAPAWTAWIFGMFGARALGYAVGLIVAMRDPQRHRLWIVTMIGIQAVDWVLTVMLILQGALTLTQASTAAFMPVLFVIALALTVPRGGPTAALPRDRAVVTAAATDRRQ